MAFINPRSKLAKISSNKHQLWVVCYVNVDGTDLVESAFRDIDATFEGGGDAAVLINEWCNLQELESTMAAVRQKFPNINLGVNFLGTDDEPYGYKESFRLARDYNLQIVWTDFTGVDQINEKPDVNLHDIEAQRPESVFYCSGVHMKYSTLRHPEKSIEKSALQAMGWVDGVIITGLKTGMACDPQNAQRAREVLGHYPLGVASGVSADNFATIAPYVDFCLVASSLQNEQKRIVKDKVLALRQAMSK